VTPPKTLRELQGEHAPAPPSFLHGPRGEAGEHAPVRNYVRDLILGFNDGLVSVYAIVAGVTAAAFTNGQIAVAGLAAAVAGALSMGMGEYLSTKSQTEYYRAEAQREREHIRAYPDLEKAEVREMLEKKGFPEDAVARIANHVTTDEDRFVEFMMREEFGVGEESERSPFIAMLLVMLAFVVGAVFPVVLFVFLPRPEAPPTWAFLLASALSLGALFVAGASKNALSRISPWKGGIEMTLLGAGAAAVTYGVGTLFGVAV